MINDKHNADDVVPEVLSDEEGSTYFASGHIDRVAFAFAVVLDMAENVGDYDALDIIGPKNDGWRRDLRSKADAFISRIEYVWMVEDADEEEMMHRCSEDDPGALAFTQVTL